MRRDELFIASEHPKSEIRSNKNFEKKRNKNFRNPEMFLFLSAPRVMADSVERSSATD